MNVCRFHHHSSSVLWDFSLGWSASPAWLTFHNCTKVTVHVNVMYIQLKEFQLMGVTDASSQSMLLIYPLLWKPSCTPALPGARAELTFSLSTEVVGQQTLHSHLHRLPGMSLLRALSHSSPYLLNVMFILSWLLISTDTHAHMDKTNYAMLNSNTGCKRKPERRDEGKKRIK